MKHKLLYCVSGRSFHSEQLGRKLMEIVSCWSKNHTVHLICGGDITQSAAAGYGAQTHHEAEFRKSTLLQPFVHSASECKDMWHDFRLLFHLLGHYNDTYSLVWERSSRLHISSLVFAKIKGVPYTLEWKDNLVNYRFSLLRQIAIFQEHIKLRQADWIVVESQKIKRQLLEQGISARKTIVAHNAVDLPTFARNIAEGRSYRKSININEHTIVATYIGSYAFYHSTHLMIEAASLIFSENPDLNIVFLMVGNGLERTSCERLAQELGLNDEQVMFQDGIPPQFVPNVLSASDITILPGSTDIICPIKIVEYMAAGTAVVAPDFECNREIAEDTEISFFEPGNANSLSKAIVSLMSEKDRLQEFSKKALKKSTEYSWESTWEKALLNCLKGV